jgi:hypothetical protein
MHHQLQQLGDIGLERPALLFVLLERGHGGFPSAAKILVRNGVTPVPVQAGHGAPWFLWWTHAPAVGENPQSLPITEMAHIMLFEEYWLRWSVQVRT